MADETISIDIEIENVKADTAALNAQVEEIDNDLKQHSGYFDGLFPDANQYFATFADDARNQLAKVSEAIKSGISKDAITYPYHIDY